MWKWMKSFFKLAVWNSKILLVSDDWIDEGENNHLSWQVQENPLKILHTKFRQVKCVVLHIQNVSEHYIWTAVLRSTSIHNKTTQNCDVTLEKINTERTCNEEKIKGNTNNGTATNYGCLCVRTCHLRLGLPQIVVKVNEIVSQQ